MLLLYRHFEGFVNFQKLRYRLALPQCMIQLISSLLLVNKPRLLFDGGLADQQFD